MTCLHILYISGGGSTVRCEEMKCGMGYARQEPASSPLFQWGVLYSRCNAFQQGQLIVGQDVNDNSAVIPYTGMQSNSAILVGCHITNSGREYLPQL